MSNRSLFSAPLRSPWLGLLVSLSLLACDPPEDKRTNQSTTQTATASPSPVHPLDASADGGFEIGRPGGTRTLAVQALPNSFNPYLGSEQSSLAVLTQMFIGLMRIDGLRGAMDYALAESLTPSADQRVWTVKLRPGLKWSDGQPLTAEDVVFTYNQVIDNPGIPNNYRDFWAYQGSFPKVEALDARTVKFSLSQPFAPFQNNLVAPILPKHVFAQAVKPDDGGKVGFNSMWGLDAAPDSIVVNGPWKLASYRPGARVELTPNPQYFEHDVKGRQLPYLRGISLIEAGDPNLALLKFQHGETDAYLLRPDDYDLLAPRQQAEHFKIHNLGPSASQLFVTFNQSTASDERGKPLVDPIKSAWFRDRRFREALALAIDKPGLIQSVYQGRALSQFSHLSQLNPFYDSSLQDYGYDLGKAQAELTAAGFKRDSQGQLRDSGGHPVKFELATNSANPERDAICAQLRSQWRKLGISADYRPRLFNLISRQLHEGHDWEVVVFGLGGSAIEPHFSASRWKRGGRMHLFNAGGGPNWQGRPTAYQPWEAEIEKLYADAAISPDSARRKQLYAQAQQIERRELPFIYLVSELNLLAVRDNLGNARPTIFGGSGLQQLNWNSQYHWIK